MRTTELDAKCYNCYKIFNCLTIRWLRGKSIDLHYSCIFALPMPCRGCNRLNVYFHNFITFCVGRKTELNEHLCRTESLNYRTV